MQKLDAKRNIWGDPDAFLPNGKGGKVTAGVKALRDARESLENLRMKLRAATVPFGAPQQPPQGLVQPDLGPGGGGSSPTQVAALTASIATVQEIGRAHV